MLFRKETTMAKFSTLTSLSRSPSVPDTINHEGGRAFTQSAKLEFISILLTTFLEDDFYRTDQQTTERIRQLISKINEPRFVAKAALYVRHAHGLRSVSHLVASELAKSVKGASWSKSFFDRIVRRPDDAVEILACYLAFHGRPVPNSLKRGLGSALGRFDEYQLAKYRRSQASFKLIDAVNLLHPSATPALSKLVRGELAPAQTWETKLAEAGQAGTTADVAVAKAAAWSGLVRERKLGYLALLRNLSNILNHAPEVVDELCQQLADERAVRRALIFPFQFLSAVEVVQGVNRPAARQVLEALNQAVDYALVHVPVFEGPTLVALDSSASMAGRPQAIGSLFAATLVKALGADLMLFSDDARWMNLNRRDSTLTLANCLPFESGGTNFNAIFQRADRAYERIVILSDMQGWIGDGAPVQAWADYQRRHSIRPRIYSFDLNGYGTLQFPQEGVYCLAGWSDRVFEIMQKLDRDPQALIHEVDTVELEA
ncbi:MAG: TROVE domain-containing protein [Opitutaceae bacterium]|nr:TROVE domain-containing protein [Opitutaceae bacterium]